MKIVQVRGLALNKKKRGRPSGEPRAKVNYFSNFHLLPCPHLWFLYMAASSPVRSRRREVSVLYDHLACAEYRRRCVRRLYTPVCTVVYPCTQILYTYGCISVFRFYIRVCCFGDALYGDWSLLAKFLRPLKQPTSTVGWFQFCDPLKKDNAPLIVILGIRRALGQNSLDSGTEEG